MLLRFMLFSDGKSAAVVKWEDRPDIITIIFPLGFEPIVGEEYDCDVREIDQEYLQKGVRFNVAFAKRADEGGASFGDIVDYRVVAKSERLDSSLAIALRKAGLAKPE